MTAQEEQRGPRDQAPLTARGASAIRQGKKQSQCPALGTQRHFIGAFQGSAPWWPHHCVGRVLLYFSCLCRLKSP